MDERVLRGGETFDGLVGIFVGELVEREGELLAQPQRLGERVRRVAEQARHLLRGFQMALGIDGEPPAGVLQRHVLADAGEHVGELAPVGMMIEHVVDGDQRHVCVARQRQARGQPRAVVAAVEHGGGQPHAARRGFAQARQRNSSPCKGEGFFVRRSLHHHQLEPVGMLEQVVELQDAVAFLGAQIAAGEQAAELCPAGAVARIGQDVGRAVGKDEARAGMVAQRQLLLALDQMGAHHAGHRVAVGEAEPGEAGMLGLHDELLGMRGAAQEGEIRGGGEFDVHRVPHANVPCRNQSGAAVSR